MATAHRRALALLPLLPAAITSCGDNDDTTASNSMSGSIVVFAATSLTNAMSDLESAFVRINPGARITFSFAGSSTLAANIIDGAPADVFASADLVNMDVVADADLTASAPQVFTTNSLEIMVRAGNPLGISDLSDLASSDVNVATCTDGVPIRTYTDAVLERAGVTAHFVTYEANVGGVVTKITSGAADAGIVYRTDVIAAGSRASGVRVPGNQNLVTDYPIAVLRSSSTPAVAQAFVDFVLSPDGQAIINSYGFGEG